MHNLNFKSATNLQLVPVSAAKRTQYCKHCGCAVDLMDASFHLVGCRPDIFDAIEREFDGIEAKAIAIAN